MSADIDRWNKKRVPQTDKDQYKRTLGVKNVSSLRGIGSAAAHEFSRLTESDHYVPTYFLRSSGRSGCGPANISMVENSLKVFATAFQLFSPYFDTA